LEIIVCDGWGEGLWELDFALCCVLLWDCKTARLGFCHFSFALFGSTLSSSPLTAPLLPRAELLIVDVDYAMLCIGAEVVAEDGLPSAAVDVVDVRLPVLKAVFGGSGGAVFVGAHAASADHQRFLDGRQYTRTAIRRSGWRLTWCLAALLLLCQSW
jgi:hypothetical protein